MPINFKGLYDFTLSGIRFGRMGIEIEQTPASYSITADIETTGLVRTFVKHTSHTTTDAVGRNYAYPDLTYETRYRTRNKPKYLKMVFKNGKFAEETVTPPESPDRPGVAQTLKDKACDPLSFIMRMRQGLHDTLLRHPLPQGEGSRYSITVFDGRRLTEANFTVEGRKTIKRWGKVEQVIAVGVRRKLLAGFTSSELSKHDPGEPTLHVYFSDDAQLIPVRLEAPYLFGTMAATLTKECRTGESCLLGLRD